MPAKHQVVSKITFLVKRKRSEQLGKLSFATRVIVVVHGVVDRDIAIVIVGGLWLVMGLCERGDASGGG